MGLKICSWLVGLDWVGLGWVGWLVKLFGEEAKNCFQLVNQAMSQTGEFAFSGVDVVYD